MNESQRSMMWYSRSKYQNYYREDHKMYTEKCITRTYLHKSQLLLDYATAFCRYKFKIPLAVEICTECGMVVL